MNRTEKKREAERTHAVSSLLLVMKYVRSSDVCKSATGFKCTRSLLRTSSPVFASKRATSLDSCPLRITCVTCAKVHTVSFEPIGLNSDAGSRNSGVKMSDDQTCKRSTRCEHNVLELLDQVIETPVGFVEDQ